ncbi:MAG: HU family DNA-binding protein [Bacteroidales bacterium]
MTKADIITNIVKQTGIEKAAAEDVVNTLMTSVKNSMIKGENVYLRGFGTFVIRKRQEKIGRNIPRKTFVTIPAHSTPRFKPCKTFLNKVKQNVEVE